MARSGDNLRHLGTPGHHLFICPFVFVTPVQPLLEISARVSGFGEGTDLRIECLVNVVAF